MKHHRSTPLITLGAAALLAAALAPTQRAEAGIFKAGVEVFIPVSGDGTVDSTTTDTFVADGAQDREEEFDESTPLGLTLYGTLGVIPFLDVGLALHFTPDFKLTDKDKVEYPLGSATDLNLRLGTTIPLPAIDLSIYGEGGLTLFGLTDEDPPEACKGGGVTSRLCQLYERDDFTDETSPVGLNAGVGAMIRYGVVPFFGVHAGLDFHFYSFQLFKGTNNTNNTLLTEDLTGTRFRLFFGVDFDL